MKLSILVLLPAARLICCQVAKSHHTGKVILCQYRSITDEAQPKDEAASVLGQKAVGGGVSRTSDEPRADLVHPIKLTLSLETKLP